MNYTPPRYLFRRFEILRGLRRGERFLEIGAAQLTLATELLSHFTSGVGIDFTPDINNCHARLPESIRNRLDVMCGDFFDLEITGRFDCVVTCEVMEHVEEDRKFLVRISELLVPGGQLILSVPARDKYWTVHDEIVGHIRRYEKSDLQKLIVLAGFDNVKVISYGWPWVNLLRLPRIFLAKKQMEERAGWSKHLQTVESNHRQIPEKLSNSRLRYITSPILFSPFARVSSIFGKFDLSDGYIVFADKLDIKSK